MPFKRTAKPLYFLICCHQVLSNLFIFATVAFHLSFSSYTSLYFRTFSKAKTFLTLSLFIPGGLRKSSSYFSILEQQESFCTGWFSTPGAIPISTSCCCFLTTNGASAAGTFFRQFSLVGRKRLFTTHLVLRGTIQTGASGRSLTL